MPNFSYNKESLKSSINWNADSTTEETPQPTKHKTEFQKTYQSSPFDAWNYTCMCH